MLNGKRHQQFHHSSFCIHHSAFRFLNSEFSILASPRTTPRAMFRPVAVTLEMIKFQHTIFALPFAFLGAFVAANGFPDVRTIAWILVAMVGARSAAMAFNRLVDAPIDAKNPRTSSRALPAGLVSRGFVALFTIVSAAVFVIAAWQLNRLALVLSP